MIKKSTLIVLVCAAVLAVAGYYLNKKYTQQQNAPTETYKPAFTFPASDITGFTVTRPAKADQPAVELKKSGSSWRVVQPIDTDADGSVVDVALDNLTSARITQSEPGTPDRLKAFGLDPANISVTLQLKSGAKHSLLIGEKVFDGASVYTVVDGAKSVSVLPDSVLTSSDKTADDWRDHTVLHVASDQLKSFAIKNPSGELDATKSKNLWTFTKPVETRADQDSIDSLLNAVQNAKFTQVVSEKPDDLAKYGLSSPAVSFTATNDAGNASTFVIGKKDGSNYFARDLSRPMIFHVNADLYTQLTKTLADLRDKKPLHFDTADINRVEIQNDHGDIVVESKGNDTWVIDSPAAQKGKDAIPSRMFDPLTTLQSDKINDHPGADITSKLAKPAVEVTLTDKNKQTTTLRMSKPVGDVVYAQVSGSPSVYMLKKADMDGLNFEASLLVQ